MTRGQRAAHPVLWALVLVASLVAIVLAWKARPEPVPATLPDAAAQAVEGGR